MKEYATTYQPSAKLLRDGWRHPIERTTVMDSGKIKAPRTTTRLNKKIVANRKYDYMVAAILVCIVLTLMNMVGMGMLDRKIAALTTVTNTEEETDRLIRLRYCR